MANAEQRAALARSAADQSALREVATLVASDPQPRAVFALVAEQAARVLGVEWGLVTRFEPSGQGRVVGGWAASARPAPVPGVAVGLDGDDATSLVARTGREARVEPAPSPRATRPWTPADAGRRGLACPVRVEGRVWGAVAVASGADER